MIKYPYWVGAKTTTEFYPQLSIKTMLAQYVLGDLYDFTSGKHSARWVWTLRPSGSYFLTRSPSPTRSSSSQLGTNLGVTTGAIRLKMGKRACPTNMSETLFFILQNSFRQNFPVKFLAKFCSYFKAHYWTKHDFHYSKMLFREIMLLNFRQNFAAFKSSLLFGF